MSLTKYEKETVVLYNQEEDFGEVYTHDKSLMTKLKKYGLVPIKEERDGNKIINQTFKVPKSWSKISPPRKASNKQKEMASARMAAMRKKPITTTGF